MINVLQKEAARSSDEAKDSNAVENVGASTAAENSDEAANDALKIEPVDVEKAEQLPMTNAGDLEKLSEELSKEAEELTKEAEELAEAKKLEQKEKGFYI